VKHFDTITLHEAVVTAVEKAKRKEGSRRVLLTEALGCILAKDIIAKKNLPSFDNSAMDGFAFRHKEAGRTLCVAKSIFAGEVPEPILKENECYKIMTGAQIPSDVDTVVPIEQCTEVTQESVTIPAEIKKGSNFRKKGEEVSVGDVLLETGTILRAAEIALLSAQGIVAVEVVIPLRIAIVSTGDEIREPWEEASEDEIYNANAFGISALLKHYGFTPDYVGAIPDARQGTIDFIASLKGYDVIITTGGISQGDADFLYEGFMENGLEPLFHGINLKPGRPTMMGTMQNTFVMAMPGNPLTTMLTVHAVSIPVLYKIAGAKHCFHNSSYARFSEDLTLRPGRTNMVIGELKNGLFSPARHNKIGSGMLTPLTESNAVVYFGESVSQVRAGELVRVVSYTDPLRSSSNDTVYDGK
jgi:molybdopterin molybdotransferase